MNVGGRGHRAAAEAGDGIACDGIATLDVTISPT
jgi:hypothetical protein